MSVGYPDYTRLDRAGGYLLYGEVNVTPPYDTVLFQGYVGLWPYLNLAVNMASSTDYVRLEINWYSDDTYTNLVGFRRIVRGGAQFSVTQYANLSEWAQLFYVTQSGDPIEFAFLGLYAATDTADQIQLVSTDVPILQFDGVIDAGDSETIVPQHVQPGPTILTIWAEADEYYVTLAYYDWGTPGYLRLTDIDNTVASTGGVFTISMLDTPYQIIIHNNDASNETFRVSLVST